MFVWHRLHQNQSICGFVVDDRKIHYNKDDIEYSMQCIANHSVNGLMDYYCYSLVLQKSIIKHLKQNSHNLKIKTFSFIKT